MSKVLGILLSIVFIIIALPLILVGSVIFGVVMSIDWIWSLLTDKEK